MTPLLDDKDVQAGYGDMRVLYGLSLHIGPQESIGLFGPNGHGKTTLLKTISSLVRPTAGSITFDGTDITGRKPPAIVEAGLIHAPQGNTLFGNMRIAETLEVGAFSKVAAGSVVVKPVPPHCTVAGVPAAVVRIHRADEIPAETMDQNI